MTKEEIERRQEAENKIKPKADKITPPSWLNAAAKKEFKRLVKELTEVELVTNVDVNALALYCDAYSDYVKFTDIINSEGFMVEHTNKAGMTNEVPHPLIAKKKQLHEQMRALASEFGLSPASRARIALPRGQPVEGEDEITKTFGDI